MHAKAQEPRFLRAPYFHSLANLAPAASRGLYTQRQRGLGDSCAFCFYSVIEQRDQRVTVRLLSTRCRAGGPPSSDTLAIGYSLR